MLYSSKRKQQKDFYIKNYKKKTSSHWGYKELWMGPASSGMYLRLKWLMSFIYPSGQGNFKTTGKGVYINKLNK